MKHIKYVMLACSGVYWMSMHVQMHLEPPCICVWLRRCTHLEPICGIFNMSPLWMTFPSASFPVATSCECKHVTTTIRCLSCIVASFWYLVSRIRTTLLVTSQVIMPKMHVWRVYRSSEKSGHVI